MGYIANVFWNPPGSYLHLLVHSIGWAIVVALTTHFTITVYRASKRKQRIAQAVKYMQVAGEKHVQSRRPNHSRAKR